MDLDLDGSGSRWIWIYYGSGSNGSGSDLYGKERVRGNAIGTLVTANFTWSADRPVGCVGRSEPLRISLVG